MSNLKVRFAAVTIAVTLAAAADRPRFEVASVKPCHSAANGGPGGKQGEAGPVRWDPGRLTEECQTAGRLIRDAYLAYRDGQPWPAAGFFSRNLPEPPVSDRVLRQPIQGSPAWLSSDRYTIDAKTASPATQEMMRGPMMQDLLEDRFLLKLHREAVEFPVYHLTVARGGARLRPFREGSCIPFDLENPPPLAAPGQPQVRLCGMFLHGRNGGGDVIGTTLAAFCRLLSNVADRDVIDQTGIPGLFDLHFAGSEPDPTSPAEAARADRFAEIQRALPKLGLQLVPARATREVLVIDHIERPSGN